jgi:hypothetical protein
MSVDSSLYTLTVSSDPTGSKILDIYEVEQPLKDNYLAEMSKRGPEIVNLDVDSSQDGANKLRARLDVPKAAAGGVAAAISNVREPVLPGLPAAPAVPADSGLLAPAASGLPPAPAGAGAGEKGVEALLMESGDLGVPAPPVFGPVADDPSLSFIAPPAAPGLFAAPSAEAGTAADALFSGPAPVEPGPISQEQVVKRRKAQAQLAAVGTAALAAEAAAPTPPKVPTPLPVVYSNPAVTDPALVTRLKLVLPANVKPGDKVDNIGGNPKISFIVPPGAKGGDSVEVKVPNDDMVNDGSSKEPVVIPAEQAARSAAVKAKTGSLLREAVAQQTRKRQEQVAASVPPAAPVGLQGSTGPLATVGAPKTWGGPQSGGKKRTRKCRKTKKHRARRVASRRR